MAARTRKLQAAPAAPESPASIVADASRAIADIVDVAIREGGDDMFRVTLRVKDMTEAAVALALIRRGLLKDDTAVTHFVQAWRVAEADRPAPESNVIDQVRVLRLLIGRRTADA